MPNGVEGAIDAARGIPLWAWGAGGAVVLFMVLGRRGGGGAAASPARISQEQAIAQGYANEAEALRLRQQEALNEIELKREQQAFSIESLIGSLQLEGLNRQLGIEKQLTEKAKRVKFQCPPGQGSLKKDAEGKLYCRAKARKGNTLTDLFAYAEQAMDLYGKAGGR